MDSLYRQGVRGEVGRVRGGRCRRLSRKQRKLLRQLAREKSKKAPSVNGVFDAAPLEELIESLGDG
jgi:hypothetical protein